MARFHTNVDDIFDGLSEGEAQHMANKLFKHGYVSPKAPKAVPVLTLDAAMDAVNYLGCTNVFNSSVERWPSIMKRAVDAKFPTAEVRMNEREMLDDLRPSAMLQYCVRERGMSLERIVKLVIEYQS
jgi:hypothetical protein